MSDDEFKAVIDGGCVMLLLAAASLVVLVAVLAVIGR
jgi:hypothetical protein